METRFFIDKRTNNLVRFVKEINKNFYMVCTPHGVRYIAPVAELAVATFVSKNSEKEVD